MTKHLPFLLLAALAVSSLASVYAIEHVPGVARTDKVTERDDLARLFAGLPGTFVVRNLESNETTIVNADRAGDAFAPSSTFKILNSLIALELNIVPDLDSPAFPYSGRPFLVRGRRFLPKECEATLSMRTAFRYSCITAYQSIAEQVGPKRYETFIRKSELGNAAAIAARPTSFWLEGDYRVSAIDQVDFLTRLERGELPFSKTTVERVRELMVQERGRDHVLRGKTGYVFSTKPELGWFVGSVERPSTGAVSVFALNLDMTEPAHAAARTRIAKALLAELGILPSGEN
jgi:beta-lactamase class D